MPDTFHAVSATNLETDERWVETGPEDVLKALLKLKLKEWGGEGNVNVEWSEHPVAGTPPPEE